MILCCFFFVVYYLNIINVRICFLPFEVEHSDYISILKFLNCRHFCGLCFPEYGRTNRCSHVLIVCNVNKQRSTGNKFLEFSNYKTGQKPLCLFPRVEQIRGTMAPLNPWRSIIHTRTQNNWQSSNVPCSASAAGCQQTVEHHRHTRLD